MAHTYNKSQYWAAPTSILEGLECAQRAVVTQTNDPETLALAARSIAYLGGRIEEALEIAERAYTIGPNLFVVVDASGWLNLYGNRAAVALARFEHAARLNPHDPFG